MRLPGPDYAAPAKLNLFLRVVGRRADGYHLLQTAFIFLDYGDRLRFGVRSDGIIRRINELAGVAPEDDLAVRAARLLQRATGCSLGADIAVEKRLPLGGGLGGGSSDAATTLLALNQLWQTGLTRIELSKLAIQLGADVPVFIFGQSAFAEGVGDDLRAIDFPEFWYLVLTPPVAVSTKAIFSHANLTRDSIPLKIADFSAARTAWLPQVARTANDLEPVVVAEYPQVAASLSALRAVSRDSFFALQGRNARMTGSGACVFAAFASENEALEAKRRLPDTAPGFVARGLQRHPLFALSR